MRRLGPGLSVTWARAFDLPAAVKPGGMTASRRTLVWTVSLALAVVIAAGITGTAHFGGARWLPNLKTTALRPKPRTASPGPSAPQQIRKPPGGPSPQIGQI